VIIKKHQIEQICKRLRLRLVSYSFLAKGGQNINYLLESSKGKFVLRIENNKQFKNFRKEYLFLKSTNGLLGPKVYLFDGSKKIIPRDFFVEEFIEGKHPSKINNRFVIDMAKWFRKLHSRKTSKKPDCMINNRYSLLCALKPYYRNYKRYRHVLDENLKQVLNGYFNRALELCKINDNLFSDRKHFSILHRDPRKENMFYSKGKIRFIDWEFVDYNLPEWEIANFFEGSKLKDYQKKLFLKTYKYPNTEIARKRLAMIALINYCGGVGYVVWCMGLANKNPSKKRNLLKRLRKGLSEFDRLFNEVDF